MKTRKPRLRKFRDYCTKNVYCDVDVGREDESDVIIKINIGGHHLFLTPKEAIKMGLHLIHCALYVHEKNGGMKYE